MNNKWVIPARLLAAVLLATGVELVNFLLVYRGYRGYLWGNWFLVLYFPVLVGLAIFGITIYFSILGSVWKRWAIAVMGGSALTFVWLVAFAIISGRITHLTDLAVSVDGS